MKKIAAKPLSLEVQEIERQAKPGCQTSTTSHLCTCPITGSCGFVANS